MVYRGFKVESVVVKADNDGTSPADSELQREIAARRVEFVVSETVAGFHWKEVVADGDPMGVLGMVDHILYVREALADVVDLGI